MKTIKTAEFINRRTNFINRLASRNLSKTVNRMLTSGSWAIISAQQGADAFNADGSKNPEGSQSNVVKNETLKQYLQENGIGFIDNQVGLWENTDLAPDAEGNARKVPENSLFIPSISKGYAMLLGRHFGQMAIIYGQNGQYTFLDCKTGADSGWHPVASHFEHIGPGHPSFNANHTDSDGEKWRLAPPEEHARNQQPATTPAVDPAAQPSNQPKVASMQYHARPATHYFFAYLAPVVKYRDPAGVIPSNTSSTPKADDLSAWLPLYKE